MNIKRLEKVKDKVIGKEEIAKEIIETVCDHTVSHTDIDINDYDILVKKIMLML